jgi:hypothetical protein
VSEEIVSVQKGYKRFGITEKVKEHGDLETQGYPNRWIFAGLIACHHQSTISGRT